MTRLKRPLDPAAVRAADEQLYAAHADDPRPNALFGADGARRPLDATDPDQSALRREWCDSYRAALAGPQASGLPDPPAERGVADPVQPCPGQHFIAVQWLPSPDAGARKRWWPPRPPGYAGVPLVAELTNGRQESALGDEGAARFDGIPAGTCSFDLRAFFADVESALAPA